MYAGPASSAAKTADARIRAGGRYRGTVAAVGCCRAVAGLDGCLPSSWSGVICSFRRGESRMGWWCPGCRGWGAGR